jgi:hypothetical protein
MAYCPICLTDFPPRARCPEHGGLVKLLFPRTGRRPDDDLVRVATAWSEAMAQSWAEMLRNNGIDAFVKVGGAGFSFGGPPPFGYEAYVLVRASLAQRACDILEGFEEPGVLQLSRPDS